MEKFRHGGEIFDIARRLGVSPDNLLDFSANINPLGPPLCVKRAMLEVLDDIKHYPESPPLSLMENAAKFYMVDPEEIIFGNGSTELLYLLPKVMDKKQAVILAPSYVDYERACVFNNVNPEFVYLEEKEDFVLRSNKDFLALLQRPSIVFLGNPNNPTGRIIHPDTIKDLATSHPSSIFIIDEAFGDFVDDKYRMYKDRPKNVIVLISLTKFYAIPGIRLGLIIGCKEVISNLKDFLPPWSVNSVAQKIGEYIFHDIEYIKETRKYIKKQREKLLFNLTSIPEIKCYKSDANFILCRINTDKDVHFLQQELLKRHIIIRNCSNYRGLDKRYFRVAVRKEEENLYLIECLRDIFKGVKGGKRYYIRGPETKKSTPSIMFVGTSSNAGKSILAAGLCRILFQEGFKVAPFKAQNMSLNSFVTKDGGEMGRAQVLQSQACKLDPDVRMNPVLLKPSSDTGSQVIVLGEVIGNMDVLNYIEYKKKIISTVREAYDSLAEEFDVIVMEGAGSPAEINLKSHDITNMEMARYARAKTLLVGDIDRGGVFASFVGTIHLLDKWERELIKGFIINKFRGDASILKSAITFTEHVTGRPFLGIVPYIKDLGLPEEDSVSFKTGWDKINKDVNRDIKIACIDLPHISNFTDLDPFLIEPDVSLKIIKNKYELIENEFDAIIIPGSKNVIKDNEYLKKSNIADVLIDIAKNKNTEIIGICGGFQIIGDKICDPHHIESKETTIDALSLLPLTTQLHREKTLIQTSATHIPSGLILKGYEIHHGKTLCNKKDGIICVVINSRGEEIGYSTKDMKIWGSYLHGIFDEDKFRRWFIDRLREKKGLIPLREIQARYDIEENLDNLANILRQSISIHEIFKFIGN